MHKFLHPTDHEVLSLVRSAEWTDDYPRALRIAEKFSRIYQTDGGVIHPGKEREDFEAAADHAPSHVRTAIIDMAERLDDTYGLLTRAAGGIESLAL